MKKVQKERIKANKKREIKEGEGEERIVRERNRERRWKRREGRCKSEASAVARRDKR